jgi:hypothetical protein
VKNQDVLNLYQQGERNFRRQDLSGQSFIGRNLSNADFSGADIRGADFSRAILREANFTGVQSGLQRNEAILLLVFLILTAALLGAAVGFVGTLLNLDLRAYTTAFEETTAGWAMLLLLLVFALISVLEGITTGFGVFALAFTISVTVAALGPLVVSLVSPIIFAVSSAIALSITVVSSVTALTVLATTTAIAAYRTFESRAAIAVASVFVLMFVYIVIATDIVTSIVPVVPAVMLLSSYLGWRAFQGDGRQSIFLRIASALTARWGTSFRNADLTKADFSNANLNNTNFEGATLTRVQWTDATSPGTAVSSPQN